MATLFWSRSRFAFCRSSGFSGSELGEAVVEIGTRRTGELGAGVEDLVPVVLDTEAFVETGTLVENIEVILVEVGTLMEIPSLVEDTEAVVEIGILVESSELVDWEAVEEIGILVESRELVD